jgi:hypothetical protein
LKNAKDQADFVSIEFEFPELEGKNLKHNFSLVGNQMLKFQNSEQEAFQLK